MKAWIDCVEWYPVYTLNAENKWDEADQYSYEVPAELVEEYNTAAQAFDAVQLKLRTLQRSRSPV